MPTPDLNDNALTTLARAKSELGVSTSSSDDLITRLINEASDLLERECSRRLYHATEHVERVEGKGGAQLILADHVPIEQIRDIVFDDGQTTETVDATDYELIQPDKGMIRRVNGQWRDTREERTEIATHAVPGTGQALYRVTYDGGWITPQQDDDGVGTRDLPHDIERATLEYVALHYAQSGTNPNIDSSSMSNASIDFVTTDDGRLPSRPRSFDQVIQNYIFQPMA